MMLCPLYITFRFDNPILDSFCLSSNPLSSKKQSTPLHTIRNSFRNEIPILRNSFCKGSVNDLFIGTNLANIKTTCPENKNCSGNVDTIFIDLDFVLTTTSEATPACMAIYGSNIDESEIENSYDGKYDQCGLLFDLGYEYAKWVDLKCNQRTRALMCSILGSLVHIKRFIDINVNVH